MAGAQAIRVAISNNFLEAFTKIPKQVQTKVRTFIEKFMLNPKAPGINYEKINDAKDKNVRSVRIDQAYRGIVLQPEEGNVYLLLWVDHHDEAYNWARNKIFNIHPETGGIQIIDPKVQDVVGQKQEGHTAVKGLFDRFKDKELIQLGIPEMLISLVRGIKTESELDQAVQVLPQEAFEGLFLLAAGYSLEEALSELEKAKGPQKIDTTDFIAALDNLDTQRRFHVVEDATELLDILNSPLEQWRIFLHPTQRKVVEWNANGPIRVLGGAGTGKTVVAMHRAKWLAERVFTKETDKILFTTFTKNLAADIQDNLRKLCPPDLMKRIEVVNLDSWVAQFLKKNGYEFTIAFDDTTRPLWQNAMNLASKELELDTTFYYEEWRDVIQAQGITTLDEYLKATRVGRKKKLSRLDKNTIWLVFEEYRAQLIENELKEFVDAIRDARVVLEKKGDILPYRAVVVDEAQDMGMEAFKLIRQMVPNVNNEGQNDIFIVGDAHQRIYRQKVVLSRAGINIKGRSRKLKINYRTTDEIRKWAVRLLEGKSFDDLDGEQDTQKGYKSLLHGQYPEVQNYKSFGEEVSGILKYLQNTLKEDVDHKSICLVARTTDLLKQYEGSLKGAGLETFLIKRSIAEDRKAPGVRLATMHRVKGLEFDYVIIAGANEGIIPFNYGVAGVDNLFDEENEISERSLLYVAATRAKKNVLITSYGKRSKLLD